jgi:fucose 4-O-acetylase-like acetyltransferase
MCNRVKWADQVKAICIILMVFCHAGCTHGNMDLLKFIYIFHMPLFFFVSGYFDKGQCFSAILLKKMTIQLLIPYFIWGIAAFSICWSGPFFHPDHYNTYSLVSVITHGILGLLLMQNDVTPYSYLTYGPLWFLPALFFTKVAFSILIGIRDTHGKLTNINKWGGNYYYSYFGSICY